MAQAVGKQDFEAYGAHKPFNYVTNPVWEKLVGDLVAEFKQHKDINQISILDYGCGDGKLFPNLVRLGIPADSIHGIEVSNARIERCKSIGFQNVQYLPLNQKLPYPDHSFDIINYLEVIEHVPASEIDFYLSEMARVLKPGGAAIITTPNYPIKRVIDIYYGMRDRKWTRLKDDPTHVTFYNPQRLSSRLSGFFEKVEILPYKMGPFYSVLKSPFFLHKIVAVCRKKDQA